MNQRLASILAFGSTVAASLLAAGLMTGSAWAEGPIGDNTAFVGSRTRAEVQAELMANRHLLTSAASEYALQQGEPRGPANGYTAAQARAEYIASRDEVRAMNSEHGGSGHFASAPARTPGVLFARRLAQ